MSTTFADPADDNEPRNDTADNTPETVEVTETVETPAAPTGPPAVVYIQAAKPTIAPDGSPISEKSRLAAALLCWFLGVFGIHRFYVGKIGTGILMLVTLGGLGIWVLIDLIIILIGSFRDKENKLILNWQ